LRTGGVSHAGDCFDAPFDLIKARSQLTQLGFVGRIAIFPQVYEDHEVIALFSDGN
jgi:hypothetical protein